MAKRRQITRHTVERLQRAAYEYQALARAFRADGFMDFAVAAADMGHRLSNMSRNLEEKFDANA